MNYTCQLILASFLAFSAGISTSSAEKIGPGLLQRLNQSSISIATARVQEQTIPVIVEFSDKINLHNLRGNKKNRRKELLREIKAQHKISQRSIRRLLRQYGISRKESLWLINGLSFDAPISLINDLVAEPTVQQIRLDYQIMAPAIGTGGSAPAEWNLNRIGTSALWDMGITGFGVVVANMDTGVDFNHSQLSSTWRGGSNSWYDPHCQAAPWQNPVLFQAAGSCPANTDFSIPRDRAGASTGHGSQTMGIMVGGVAADTGTSIGVAPDAQWIATKIFNDDGAASLTAIHKAFQWLLDPDNDPLTDDAPDIVNASWVLAGESVNQCVLEFQADIQALKAVDIAVVFAAGNEGGAANPYTSTSPGNNPEGYAVGAVDSLDRAASWSSRGPGPIGPGNSTTACSNGFFPELMAPGVAVRTTNKNAISSIDSYVSVSGTSFAAPHVAGAMALLLDAVPNLSVSDLENIIMNTAHETVNADDAIGADDIYGFGVLDVEAAYYAQCPVDGLDSDSDGIPDVCDNCTMKVNPWQEDTDGDLFGDICDGDLDNNGIVNFGDINVMFGLLGQNGPAGDFDNNQIVNFGDINVMFGFLNNPPGPSGLVQ